MSGGLTVLCYARNDPYSYDAHTPVPILALGSFLERAGREVEYFDERIDPAGRLDVLLARKPALVGFSVIGGYQIAASARLSRRVRRLAPCSRIVWGGISPTTLPRETLAEEFVDYVALGEAEETLLALVEALEASEEAVGTLAGLGWKRGGEPVLNPPRTPPDLEGLPLPYEGKGLALLKRYLARGSVREFVGYEASRGCPFLCRFCYSPNFHAQVRVKSRAKVAAELARLRELGAADLDVYDDTLLGGRRAEIEAFAELSSREGLGWIGNLRVNMLSPELLSKLEASGCRWLYFGLESNDDETLRRMQKGFTAQDIRRGVSLMKGSRIPAVYSLIAGLPLPGSSDLIGPTLDFAEELHRLHPAAEVQVQSYVPLPGSDFYGEAVSLGFRPHPRLLDWARHDHFTARVPWIADPGLPNALYLSSFLAYRYRRHLSGWPWKLAAYPLHLLSRWRLRRRAFGLYFERPLYRAWLATCRAWVSLRLALRDAGGLWYNPAP